MISFPSPIPGAALCLALVPLSALAESDVDLDAGRKIFLETAAPSCSICHTLADAGSEGEIGPNLNDFKPTADQVRAAVTSGIGVMPAFGDTLTGEQIATVAAYVAAVTGQTGGAAEPTADDAATADEAAAAASEAGATIVAMGDAGAGEKVFRRCKACHSVDQGGANKVGPNLYDIVDAPVAAVDGFRYSDAMTEYGGTWSPERLDAFLAAPKAEMPGTRMSFAGLRKDEDRADVIAYLAAQSDAN